MRHLNIGTKGRRFNTGTNTPFKLFVSYTVFSWFSEIYYQYQQNAWYWKLPVSVMTNIWQYRYIPWIHSLSVWWQTYDITDIYHEFIPHQWDDKHMTLQIYTMNSFPVSEMTSILWHYRYIPWIHSLSVRWQTYDIA